MRALRPMTQEEREFAEQKHDLVVEFLRRRHLPMNDYYDIVIFGYLSAVQQYFRDPPIGVEFRAMAFRAMKDSILRGREYNSRAKRCGVTVSLDDADNPVTASNPAQDTERQIEGKSLLEQAASVATPKEAKIIGFLLDGFALHEAARLLKMPRLPLKAAWKISVSGPELLSADVGGVYERTLDSAGGSYQDHRG